MPEAIKQHMDPEVKQWVKPTGRTWGRFPIYQAKVGTGPGTLVIVWRLRRFAPKMRIRFCTTDALRGIRVGVKPKWETGTVDRTDADRLFISQ